MNILFVNSIGRKKFGGGERWMIYAAQGLKERGHTVFLASRKNSELASIGKNTNVSTCGFNIRFDFSPINTFLLYRFLLEHNVQIVVCNLNRDVRVAGTAARLAKKPLVIARHGVSSFHRKKWRYKVIANSFIDGIITNTKTIRQKYSEYGWFDDGFVRVIYNGIRVKEDVVGYDFSDEFPGKKIVFSAGRLSHQKGYEYLIEAAALLFQKRNDLVFIVAGKGKQEKNLNRLVRKCQLEDSFHFWGFLDDIGPYLKGCDLFVLSSLYEGMPNVVMEAMAVGKAVVATDVNGVQELMEDGKTGIIVPPRDAGALAEAIEELIDQPQLLKKCGLNGMERVKHSFTLSRMLDELETYFQEMLNGRSS